MVIKRFVIALVALAAIVTLARTSIACTWCGCCRVDSNIDPIDPYVGVVHPLAAGTYETGQYVPAPGGVGSSVIPIDPGSWSLVLMPDTQIYSQDYPSIFTAQTQWIKNNVANLNIKYVLHEGDIVNVAADTAQWVNSRTSLDVLNGVIPYALAPGNHDYGGQGANRTTLFDNGVAGQNYYGMGTPYASQPSIGGFYQAGKTDNSWHTFTANGENWLVFALEWGPRDAVVQWADQVADAHPDYNTILVTHAYMYNDDTIYDWATKGSSQSWNPHSYGINNLPGGVNDGQELWDKFVKKHESFKFVFNGHVLGDGTGKRATIGDNGNVVHQILANYQFNTMGGQGDMRVLEFKPDGETVVVRTYSPTLDRYNTSADQQFTLSMNSTFIAPPVPIGHAVVGNLIASGPTDPSANTVDSLTVPQSSAPGVGVTTQINRGDFQPSIGGGAVTYNQGIMLASITEHARADFTYSAGVFRRATVEVGRNSFGDGNLALSVMEAGSSPVAASNEVNFNTSVAWFPFDSGFRGAHVNGDGSLVPTAFNGVAQSMVTRTNTGRYTVNLGVNSQTSGMLFTIGNNNENVIVQTGPAANGADWDVRVQSNAANFSATGADKMWSFLYVDYKTPNLVGGYYDGFTGSSIHSAGSFTMTRTTTGQYELTVPGQTPDTGMLILSVAYEATSGGTTAPDDNFLTYATGANGKFTINSFDLPTLNSSSNNFGLQDTKFVWAFISFANPLAPYVIPGDYNRDALVDDFDYQTWRASYGKSSGWLPADGNGDGVVDTADYVLWRNNRAGSGSGSGPAIVPEPACAWLLLGAIGFAMSGRRFRRHAASRIFE